MVGVAGAVFLFALADASQCDLRQFRIPNRDFFILLMVFPVVVLSSGMGGREIFSHFAAFIFVFTAGALLFRFGVWGGGDAKLLAAVALWTGFADLPRMLMVMSLAGGILALILLTLRCLPSGNSDRFRVWIGSLTTSGHVPYGVAISLGGLDWLLNSGSVILGG